MPTSDKQKTTACMVLAMRKGEMSPKKFPRVAGMMKDMSTEDLEKMCHGDVKKE